MSDRIALVTGAGRGIGRAIALGLADAGHRVAITARSEDQLTSLASEIEAAGGQVQVIVADLVEQGAVESILQQVADHWGPVEILVNNAGLGSSSNPKPLVEFDDDFWDLTMKLNVTVPYRLTKLALRAMIESGWGRIINTASINAKQPGIHGAAYTASKHAIGGLTKATAIEVAEHGITANAICPGVTRSLMNDKRLEYDVVRTGQTFEQLEAGASPLGRRLEPEEIASLAVFLAADASRGINGQLINVCGGKVMW